jgi:hypothetical protein
MAKASRNCTGDASNRGHASAYKLRASSALNRTLQSFVLFYAGTARRCSSKYRAYDNQEYPVLGGTRSQLFTASGHCQHSRDGRGHDELGTSNPAGRDSGAAEGGELTQNIRPKSIEAAAATTLEGKGGLYLENCQIAAANDESRLNVSLSDHPLGHRP